MFSRFLSVLYSFLLSCVRSLICVQLRGSWLIRQLWCICGVISARQFALLTQPPIQLKSIHVHGNKILNCQCLQPSSHIKHISVGLIELINSQAIITFNTVLFAIIYQFFFICLKPYCPTAQFSTIHFTLNTTSPIESFVRIWPTSCCTSTHHFAKDQVARSRWLDLLIGSLVGTFLPHLIINVRALYLSCLSREPLLCPLFWSLSYGSETLKYI